MTTIRESAMAYEPPQVKNIAELEYVSADIELVEEVHKDKENKEFKVNVTTINGDKYRVPNSVLEGLKVILKKFPDTKYFCVDKSGEGMSTRYAVLPHEGPVEVKKDKI